MSDVEIKRDTVNLEGLDGELRVVLGAGTSGVSFLRGVVTVHLTDAAGKDAADVARKVVADHDPSILTASQVERHDLRQKVEEVRAVDYVPIDQGKIQDPLLLEFAKRIEALETELRARKAGF